MTVQESIIAEKIGRLNKQWMEAYTKRDTEFLKLHMSDDYVSTFPDGSVHNKTSEIESVRSGAVSIHKMEPSEMNVRVYENAAVITGQSSIKATVDGQNLSDKFRFTDVWIKRDAQWKAVASQVTRIQ